MIYLVIVSLIWAFSFGLISTFLKGVDPYFVASARIGIALLVFLPFFKKTGLNKGLSLKLMAIGAVQYGVMYASYMYTYQFMDASKIALFTVTTPVFVSLVADLLEKRFQARYLLFAVVATLGALVVNWKDISYQQTFMGILLLQFSNLCFAVGQVHYRKIMKDQSDLIPKRHYALLYLGGFIVTALLMCGYTDFSSISLTFDQISVILILGLIASGLGFFLWNYGATQVEAGLLASMNNLKVPLAVVVSLLFFGGAANILRLLIGGAIIIGAVIWCERSGKKIKG